MSAFRRNNARPTCSCRHTQTSTLLLWSVIGHNIVFSPNDSLLKTNCNYLQRYVVKNINVFNGKPFLTLFRPAPLFLTDIISEQYEGNVMMLVVSAGVEPRTFKHDTRSPTESRSILLVGQICRSY